MNESTLLSCSTPIAAWISFILDLLPGTKTSYSHHLLSIDFEELEETMGIYAGKLSDDDSIDLEKIQNQFKNDELNLKIDYYSNQTEKVLFVDVLNLYDVNELHNYIILYLSNWWK